MKKLITLVLVLLALCSSGCQKKIAVAKPALRPSLAPQEYDMLVVLAVQVCKNTSTLQKECAIGIKKMAADPRIHQTEDFKALVVAYQELEKK